MNGFVYVKILHACTELRTKSSINNECEDDRDTEQKENENDPYQSHLMCIAYTQLIRSGLKMPFQILLLFNKTE